jgi:Relaxase/Mobilisation nuclease domain/Large polyvalent protein-associated domain 7
MIAKHITSKSSARARHYAWVLLTYFTDPDPRKQIDAAGLELALSLADYVKGEKPVTDAAQRVLYTGASVSGVPTDWADAADEMESRLKKRSRRIKKPVRHSVVSFQCHETASEAECQQAVDLMTEELGCGEGVVLWSAHSDTDNIHIHIIHIPLDEDGARLPYGKALDGVPRDNDGKLPRFAQEGQYKEAMQRALARIEHAQGRTPEIGSRYHVVDGQVQSRDSIDVDRSPRADVGEARARWEQQKGIKSFTRFCQDHAMPIVNEAKSWAAVHKTLAPMGIGVRRSATSSGSEGRGNGGEFYSLDGNKTKLSSVHRSISWKRLTDQSRFGVFVEPASLPVVAYRPDVIDVDQAQRNRDTQRAKNTALYLVKRRIDALQASREQAALRLRTEWISHRDDVKQIKIALAKNQLLEALRVIHTQRIRAADDAYRTRIAALRALRRSIDALEDPEILDLEALGEADIVLMSSWNMRRHRSAPVVPLDGYTTQQVGGAVQYWRTDDDRAARPAFAERGNFIWINDRSEAALTAALILAKARHGDVAAFGDAAFVRACQLAGKRLGIDVQNGGLKPAPAKAYKINPRQAARDKALDEELHSQRSASMKTTQPVAMPALETEPAASLPAKQRMPKAPGIDPFGR